MSDKYQALREALAAGPQDGPWMEHGPAKQTLDAPEGGDYCIQDGGTNVIAEVFYRVSEGVGGTRPARATAAYIAAASPDTIAALLAERDELKQRAEVFESAATKALAERDALAKDAEAF